MSDDGNTTQGKAPTTGWFEDQRLTRHSVRMPLLHDQVTQLEPGDQAFRYMLATGRDTIIIRIATRPLVLAERLPEPDWMILTLPLSWHGLYLINGQQVEKGRLYMAQSGNGFTSSARNRDSITIGLRRERLRKTFCGLLGVNPEDIRFSDCAIDLAPDVEDSLRTRLLGILRHHDLTTEIFDRLTLSKLVEADLYTQFAEAMAPSLYPDIKGRMDRKSALKLIHRIREHIDANGAAGLNASDLCRIASVEYSRLHEAYQDIFGVSPYKYLQAVRLCAAHRHLLSEVHRPRSVKDVALSIGYLKSGRFAEHYKGLFGEFPSETLARSAHGGNTSR